MGYAPVFFPGTADPGGATVLTIGPAEVHEGIDFPLQFVATSRVEGTIVGVDGRPVTTAILNLFAKRAIPLLSPVGGNTSRTDNSGKFSFIGVLPGDYTLVARAQTGPLAPPSRGGAPMPPLLWAQQDLSVSGSDVTGLGLRLQPGVSVSGRVAFEGTSPPPPDLTRVRVSLGPVRSTGMSVLVGEPQMSADGTFTFQDATPGRYRVSASAQLAMAAASGGPTAPVWWLKSVVSNGVDTLDSALEISTADVSSIVITFTDRPTSFWHAARRRGTPCAGVLGHRVHVGSDVLDARLPPRPSGAARQRRQVSGPGIAAGRVLPGRDHGSRPSRSR